MQETKESLRLVLPLLVVMSFQLPVSTTLMFWNLLLLSTEKNSVSCSDFALANEIIDQRSYTLLAYLTESGHALNVTADGIVAISSQPNTPNDGCDAINTNLTGKLALISRGGCYFDQKVINT